MSVRHLVLILTLLLLVIPASAYFVNYSVSPIANAQLTNTAVSTTRGLNVTVLNMTNRASTLTISLTGTTLTVGATKVVTVRADPLNTVSTNNNMSTLTRCEIDFPLQIPPQGTITNASLILYLNSKTTTFGAPDLIITNVTPLDPTNMVVPRDWHNYVNVSPYQIWNATPVTFQSWTASTRKVIYLNSDAMAQIEKQRNYGNIGNENNFPIGLRIEWDITANNRSMIWTNVTAQSATYVFGSKEAIVHAQDPMLNITYSMPDVGPTPTCSGAVGGSCSGTFYNKDLEYTIILGLAGLVLLAFILGRNNINK